MGATRGSDDTFGHNTAWAFFKVKRTAGSVNQSLTRKQNEILAGAFTSRCRYRNARSIPRSTLRTSEITCTGCMSPLLLLPSNPIDRTALLPHPVFYSPRTVRTQKHKSAQLFQDVIYSNYKIANGLALSVSFGNAFTFERTTVCFSCEMYPFINPL
jgi:hypothetical protein